MICISALNKTVHSIYFSWKCLINSCLLQVERNCYYSSSFCSKNFGTGPRRMLSNAISKKEENLLIPDPSPDIYSIRSVCSFFSKWQCINGSWEFAFGKKCQKKQSLEIYWIYWDVLEIYWIYWKYPQLRPLSYNSIKLIQTKAKQFICSLCFVDVALVNCSLSFDQKLLYFVSIVIYMVLGIWNIVAEGWFRRILP